MNKMTISTLDKVNFQAKNTYGDKKGHYRRSIKGSVNQEDITVFKVHEPYNRVSKYIKQTLI